MRPSRSQARGRPGRAGHAPTRSSPASPTRCCPRSATCTCCPGPSRRARRSWQTAPGEAIVAEIRARSTAGFSDDRDPLAASAPRRTAAVGGRGDHRRPVAARRAAARRRPTAGARRDRARLLTALPPLAGPSRPDAPAPSTPRATAVRACSPGAASTGARGCGAAGATTTGPVRSFRVLPQRGSDAPVRIAVAACGAQFGPIFDHLAARRADAFVWQGDLNYPDTHGPLAQTVTGYAGIWRDFLANPLLEPRPRAHGASPPSATTTTTASRTRTPRTSRLPVGARAVGGADGPARLLPLPARARPRSGCSTSGCYKSDPTLPDTPDKTLLGRAQREWLLRTLARVDAPLQGHLLAVHRVHARRTPATATGPPASSAERDLLLDHIRRRVERHDALRHRRHPLTVVYDARRALRGPRRAGRHPDAERHHALPSSRPPKTARASRASPTPTTTLPLHAARGAGPRLAREHGPAPRARGRADAVRAPLRLGPRVLPLDVSAGIKEDRLNFSDRRWR